MAFSCPEDGWTDLREEYLLCPPCILTRHGFIITMVCIMPLQFRAIFLPTRVKIQFLQVKPTIPTVVRKKTASRASISDFVPWKEWNPLPCLLQENLPFDEPWLSHSLHFHGCLTASFIYLQGIPWRTWNKYCKKWSNIFLGYQIHSKKLGILKKHAWPKVWNYKKVSPTNIFVRIVEILHTFWIR